MESATVENLHLYRIVVTAAVFVLGGVLAAACPSGWVVA